MRIKLSAAVTVIAAISTTATLITVKMKCVAHEYSVNLLKLATVYHTHKTMVNKLNFISKRTARAVLQIPLETYCTPNTFLAGC